MKRTTDWAHISLLQAQQNPNTKIQTLFQMPPQKYKLKYAALKRNYIGMQRSNLPYELGGAG